MMVLRHLLAILLLPFMAVVVVPYWLLSSFAAQETRWSSAGPLEWLVRVAGVLLFVAGFGLFGWCVSLFARVGHGTLAPWDPAQDLVQAGPYRYVRNPMISGVTAMLFGQALFWGSLVLGVWAVGFFLVNHTYFVLLEEPGLEERFGASYIAYKQEVPRWIPRSSLRRLLR
jgi:protein-S-isoprenylcysteine O-methyltransferase Ste14